MPANMMMINQSNPTESLMPVRVVDQEIPKPPVANRREILHIYLLFISILHMANGYYKHHKPWLSRSMTFHANPTLLFV